MISQELDILEDWCYEAIYSQLANLIQQAKGLALQLHSCIVDIDNIDMAMGTMMEQGPVLIIPFQAQMVMLIKNSKGKVVEGDLETVLQMLFVWMLCQGRAKPLCGRAAPGHLRLQHKAGPLSTVAMPGPSGIDAH